MLELSMSHRFKRDRARKQINELLAHADDATFLQMIWAIDLVQSGHAATAAKVLRDIPAEAEGAKIGHKYFVQPWVLEDIVNELLEVAKSTPLRGRSLMLAMNSYGGFAHIYNLMLQLQNAESGLRIASGFDVLQSMPRVGHRQFPWQRGHLNGPLFYRSAFLYGQGRCAEWFSATHGLSPSDLLLFGMAAWSHYDTRPFIESDDFVIAEIELTKDKVEAALRLVAKPLADVREDARALRRRPGTVEAKGSVLRKSPMIGVGPEGTMFMAPLRELIIERTTTGLYLDLVQGPDAVRSEVGRNFERYCFELLFHAFDGQANEEFSYGPKGKQIATPDVLVGPANAVAAIVECKATRMSFDVRFSDDWHAATDRGYAELGKGVGQIWRFRSHMRRGCVEQRPAENVIGVILTLDPWMRMTHGQDEVVLQIAHNWCADTDPDILDEDKCPIAFVHVEEVEQIAQRRDAAGILETLRQATSKVGWGINELGATQELPLVERPYPFADRLGDLLPWWVRLDEMEAAGETSA